MVKLLAELAPAKINLFLRVVGRRPDGYHDLDSIFLPISLCDNVHLALRTAAAISITIRCDSEGVPSDDDNLAARAAAAFMAEFGIAAEVLIDLQKRIPVGAGLGGGSSDAGAVLRMMAALCRIHQPARLAKVAIRLGADVPFFLNPRPSRVRGIGERLTVLESMPPLYLVIAAPPFEVSTAEVFRDLRHVEWSGAAPESDLAAIAAGEIRPAALVNDLEFAALRRCPEIGQLKAILQRLGARASAMTGSGGAVFGVFHSAEEACRAAQEGRRLSPPSRFVAASTLDHPLAGA
jgi:4-diphosphocytidyl-2-C-methyl-D-erythritol kinase